MLVGSYFFIQTRINMRNVSSMGVSVCECRGVCAFVHVRDKTIFNIHINGDIRGSHTHTAHTHNVIQTNNIQIQCEFISIHMFIFSACPIWHCVTCVYRYAQCLCVYLATCGTQFLVQQYQQEMSCIRMFGCLPF